MRRATRTTLVLTVVLLIVGVSACGRGSESPTAPPGPSGVSDVAFPSERAVVRFGKGAEVRAEVAVTPAQLARGLMYREHLGADDGMLFLFQIPGADGFYMKNTLVALSIAYMRRTATRTYQVVAVLDMEPCPPETTTCPLYPPGAYYDATLEVNKGWFARHDVVVGSAAEVDGDLPNPFDQPFDQVRGTPAATSSPGASPTPSGT